jgi:deoxyribodipyrimidine photo-lyase
MSTPIHIVWFKRDLRLNDHRPFSLAARSGPVLPLYVVEPELWRQPDASARQWRFVEASLRALDEAIRALGGPGLWLARGPMPEVLAILARDLSIAGLWSHEETGNDWTYRRDRAVHVWTKQQGIPWHEFRQDGVIRSLTTRDGWAEHWQSFVSAPLTALPAQCQWVAAPPMPHPLLLPPSISSMHERWMRCVPFAPQDDPCPHAQPGGRNEGLVCLETFLYERGRDYRRGMSSPNHAPEVCSRLSPHLAWGTVSLREVWHALQQRLDELENQPANLAKPWRLSLRSFASRLAWHCHFMQKLESEPRLEFVNLHPAINGLREEVDAARLEAWARGETGLPFVDACMRYLHQHGWINFRMRAMLAALACYHLWQPWRAAGLHLARQFIDYEPGIHWSQMQMQSGSTGINALRIYNPIKQSRDQDPEGSFIRRWVPELAAVPTPWIHEPWRMPLSLEERYGCRIGRDYPPPLIAPKSAAREARTKLTAMYRRPEARLEAKKILARHGSRKRRASSPKPGASRNEQLPLFE